LNTLPDTFYRSPYKFTFKQRLALNAVPPVVSIILKGIAATIRWEMRDEEWFQETRDKQGHVLMAIWHETLAIAACKYRDTTGHTLTSYSFDGELAARVVTSFGMRAVRGSSSRGGSEALAGLVEAAKFAPILGFTLDGPRGPRREAKPGIAVMAARTGLPIIPHAFAAAPEWRMKSWDKFIIPKPRAVVLSAYGKPIQPPENDSPEAVEAVRVRVQESLNHLQEELESELASRRA
jgi:lysophospholipid acyltransferase (LPLAT)-like uncharacterized protein